MPETLRQRPCSGLVDPQRLSAARCIAASLLLAVSAAASQGSPSWPPIALDPANPKYFLFRNRTVALVGSGEHYGAVLNLDFDYEAYLDAVAADGLTLTRTWTGSLYLEHPSEAGGTLSHNTMGPFPGRYISPWAQSDQPGYNGSAALMKFDLSAPLNPLYFERLTAFVAGASARGIVVNVGLFSNLYSTFAWDLSPLSPSNNIQGVGAGANWTQIYTLAYPELQEKMEVATAAIVTALSGFDNVFYEIINEPYINGPPNGPFNVTTAWRDRMIDVIRAADAAAAPGQPAHLLQWNVANGFGPVVDPNPAVEIYSFHYSTPGAAQELYSLPFAVSDDETGFAGGEDSTYRGQGWAFMIGGGSALDNLDYSFTIYRPNGTDVVSDPGGGSPALRASLGALQALLGTMPLRECRPWPGAAAVASSLPDQPWLLPPQTLGAVSASRGLLAVYVYGGNQTAGATATLTVTLPPADDAAASSTATAKTTATWSATWLDPVGGVYSPGPAALSADAQGVLRLPPTPAFVYDVALVLARSDTPWAPPQ